MPFARRTLLRGLPLLAAASALQRSRPAHAFVPPDHVARALALGSLRDLPVEVRAALTPDDDDRPIPPPRADDWLAAHRERGQTYGEYLRQGFNRPTAARQTIVVIPLGDSDDLGDGMPSVPDLVDFIGRFFQLPARSAPPLGLAELGARTRQHHGRRQHRSGDLLDALRRRLPADAYCTIGVTAADLYPGPKWNFVFGEARLHERVGVHSFARYDPAFYGERDGDRARTILRRGLKVMAHEVGHMLSILHCVHYRCLMNGTNHIGETDRAPLHLCPVCRRKVLAATRCDLGRRELELAEFFRARGLVEPAARCARRAATIAAAVEAQASMAALGDWLRDLAAPAR
ncbi:MAG: archaemetzincin [Nannocystaceae bacterium]